MSRAVLTVIQNDQQQESVIAMLSAEPTSPTATAENRIHRPASGRPRRHPHSRQNAERTAAGRQFGGQLTRLHADASPFIPSSIAPPPSHTHSKDQRPSDIKSAPPRQSPAGPTRRGERRASLLRSTAPDIATRTHDDISTGIYECAICTNEVARNSKIWSCQTCWTVFHIGCIKTWSRNEGAAVRTTAGEADQLRPLKQWRCPGCNLPKDALPTTYTCWCEKEINPKIITGLPPHSCGQTCGRPRTFPKACPHPCDLVCHAGPCPPCSSVGPAQVCFCGKETASRKCADTNYQTGWSCGQRCLDMMPCGDHACPHPCHEGLCGACDVKVDARCYCGKSKMSMLCNEKGEEKDSHAWTGSFECGEVCARPMDCGQHLCEKQCHPQDEGAPHCPRSPDAVTTCPCGKTALSTLLAEPRKSCMDTIPHCQQPCDARLSCGHSCTQVCHSGECLPCLRKVTISCRCGRNNFDTICHQGTEEPPQCFRVCRANLNCGRHECGERCCTGERKAVERQATKRRLKPLGASTRYLDESIEAEHICTKSCGRPLKCGKHVCQDLCHKGPCNSCKEAIFEDLTCNCGRTVLQAPLPCGTRPPLCSFPCHRPKHCGHPQVAHNCHTDDEVCPNCPFLTEKSCLCNKKTLKNQPCWRTDVLCGLVCGKRLKCGSHTCQKLCHKPGDCEDALQPCQQQCGKPKKTCEHPCDRVCHAPSVCKEDKACPFKIIITCDCQRKKEEVRCNARTNMTEPSGRQTSLKCDEECARLERNHNLALALHISDDHTDGHVPYSTATLNMYAEDIGWSHKQEEEFRLFAADSEEKRLRFKPMRGRQRAFIHSLAEDFGFDGESVDPEPHRHVLIFKTPKFVAAPMKTLAQAARIKRAALNISAPVISVSSTKKRNDEVGRSYNGFVLTTPRFALTEDELRPHLNKAAPTTDLDIFFISAGDRLALLPSRPAESAQQLTTLLTSLQPSLAAEITKQNIAASVALCQFELSGMEPVIVYQQGKDEAVCTNGWSKIAARRAVPMQAPQRKPVGQRPVYTVLGSRLAEAKQKKAENEQNLRQKVVIAEDWEKEAEEDDELVHNGGGSTNDRKDANDLTPSPVEEQPI